MNDGIVVSRSIAQEILERLSERRQQLECELTSVEGQIQEIEAQLKGRLPSTAADAPRVNGAPRQANGKAPKGENLRIVKAFLGGLSGQGATIAEISSKTKVGLSSVQVVLKRHTDIFTKGPDGLWELNK